MTRVGDGRKINSAPWNRRFVIAARPRGIILPSLAELLPARCSSVSGQTGRKPFRNLFCMQPTGRMKSGIYFSTLLSPPSLAMRTPVVAVWRRRRGALSLTEECSFFKQQPVVSTRCFERQGVLWEGLVSTGEVPWLRRQAADRLCATAHRLLHYNNNNKKTQHQRTAGGSWGRTGVEIWTYTALKWRCPSRRGNQDRRGRRRRARMRARSWRRARAAGGRSAKSRLVGLCRCVRSQRGRERVSLNWKQSLIRKSINRAVLSGQAGYSLLVV